jgi:hypothetical protein
MMKEKALKKAPSKFFQNPIIMATMLAHLHAVDLPCGVPKQVRYDDVCIYV